MLLTLALSLSLTLSSTTVMSSHLFLASSRMLSLVTPGRMSPLVRGAVQSSFSPSSFLMTKKRFMAPHSVTSSSSPHIHRTWLYPFAMASFAGAMVAP